MKFSTGGAGNDTLNDGTLANVTLKGGGGNDTYTVTSTATTVSEASAVLVDRKRARAHRQPVRRASGSGGTRA